VGDSTRLDELRRRVQQEPASIAFAQLAEQYRRHGQHHEAVDVCRAGLAHHPSYLSARVTLGRALMDLQRYEDALVEFEQVLNTAPDNLAALKGREQARDHRALATLEEWLASALADRAPRASVDGLTN
jgi:tetratricopeptide (TPR) repeat protein